MSSIGKSEVDIGVAVQQVLAGDAEAYTSIYNSCDQALRSFISSRYGHLGRDFIDEVAIRTHERAIERLAQFDPGRASFQTWLNWQSRRVASQVHADWHGPRFTGFDENLHAQYVPAVPGPEELHEQRQRDEFVRQEFAALDEEGRLTMMYHDLRGWSFAATATAMGMSVGSVRRRRDKAIAQLRRRLRHRGITTQVIGEPVEASSDSDGRSRRPR